MWDNREYSFVIPGCPTLTLQAPVGHPGITSSEPTDKKIDRSCQDMKTIALQLHKHQYSCVVKIRNTLEAV